MVAAEVAAADANAGLSPAAGIAGPLVESLVVVACCEASQL
jgi:hypothetical protein